MDIGRCFKDAWNLLMKDLAPLIVAAIIGAVVIGVVALVMGAVVGGAMFSNGLSINADTNEITSGDVNWGLFAVAVLVISIVALVVGGWEYSTLLRIMLRRVREDRVASMDDLRLGLEGLGGFIVALLVLGILIGIGFVLLVIPGVILMTIWAYALVRIADKGSGLGAAMSESTALAKAPGYVMTFVTLLVGGIAYAVISGILGMIPVVGQILSAFVGLYMIAYVVAMYFQASGETALLDHALYDAPLPAPAGGPAGYPPTPAAGTAYPPAPSAPMAVPASSAAPPPASPAGAASPPPPPPGAPAPDVWAAAADPLAQAGGAAPPAFEPPTTSPGPAVDETSGQIERHCAQCGAVIEGSDEYCQSCALEVSGGEHVDTASDEPSDEGEPKTEA
jgi:MFS family permease